MEDTYNLCILGFYPHVALMEVTMVRSRSCQAFLLCKTSEDAMAFGRIITRPGDRTF